MSLLGTPRALAETFEVVVRRYNKRRRTETSGMAFGVQNFRQKSGLSWEDAYAAWHGKHEKKALNKKAEQFRADYWRDPKHRDRLLPRIDVERAMLKPKGLRL